ncbi:hypothetical protein [Streptomyces sp. NBC_01275]|uniref:hypothetical protein n=1 Tax=Streptomyces sp. NBC_01275 TaxID=2903807 RepID=UPI00338DA274
MRQGSYFPHWLLERRRRAEQALISVVANRPPARCLHAPGREARRVPRRHAAVEIPGQCDGQASGRAGCRVPQPAP